MKEFVKDYGELWKESGRFYKKHWKGVLALNAVIIGAELAWYKYKTNQFDKLIRIYPNKEEEAQ